MHIREASAADEAAIRELIAAVHEHDHVGRLDAQGRPFWRNPANWSDVALAEADGALLGMAALYRPAELAAVQCEVLVHPAWRRRGYGRALAGWLRTQGQQRRVELVARVDSRRPGSQAFCAALGLVAEDGWLAMVADPLPTASAKPLPPGYALRPLQAHSVADMTGFADVFGVTFATHRFLMPIAVPELMQWWSGPDFDPQRVGLAEYDGAIVGIVQVRPIGLPYPDGARISGHIGPVGVLPDHQRRGLARALMLYARDYSQAQGWTLLDLDVDVHNRSAQALYESLGFRTAHTLDWWRWRLEQ